MENLNNTITTHEPESFTQDNNNNNASVAMDVVAAGASSILEQVRVKRGRGRPRKNDGNGQSMVLSTPPPPSGVLAQPLGKQDKGRPRGTGNCRFYLPLASFFFCY
ncbi:hypothetical protein RIF29_31767 [Crotalaria pallida]|uniref:AT-hook motif nuclear-localized protein n=1 Tax=Crotalaria pallida TaxID=3830 RepID=A0AAN9EJS6_CROPI